MGELHGLFNPERVAVIGATERSGSVGAAITRNLIETFDGDVIPVNPNAESVFGLDAFDTVSDAPDVDLAVVSVPTDAVLDIIDACGTEGITDIVVITAGFGETGDGGTTQEEQLMELADTYGLNIVGPNSLGVMSTPNGLNATFSPENARPGTMSFMSQSGAFVTAVVDWANEQQLGFKYIVSLGNEAVLDETDFLREWGTDDETSAIIGYLEAISDGREFIETARRVTNETPVILVKSGRTEAGAKAASSHTGALAGSDRAYEAGFKQAGVIRSDTVEDLFDAAQILTGQPLPDGDGVAVITNAGGPGVMTADAVGEVSLSLASFGESTVEALRSTMPDAASAHNPIDILGDADTERFRNVLELVVEDDHVDMIVVLAAPTAVLGYEGLAEAMIEIQRRHEQPLSACFMGGSRVRKPRDRLTEADIPCYFDPARAVKSLDALVEYARIRETEWEEPTQFDVDRERAQAILEQVTNREHNRLGVESMDLLDAYGISIPNSEIVDSAADAHRVATDIGGPVAMKIVSPDIVHKTDIGGVNVGVETDAVRDAYEEIVTRVRKYQPDASIFGVQVQAMVDVETGVETIIGVNRDPQFGPVLLFGLGGIFVEVLEDTTVRVAPIAEREARAMTTEIDASPLFGGVRGRDPVAIDAVVEAIQRLSQLVTDFPAILELDINPLVALPDGVQAIDLRLTIDPEKL